MTPRTPSPASASQASIALQFVLCGIVWGSSFLFMKVALEGISPAQVVWGRLLLGGITLGVFVVLRREPLPRRLAVWGHMTVLAVSFCVVPFLLFSWAQQHVTSGLASIGVLLGVVILGETLTWNEPVGAVVVFLGILLAQNRLRLPRRAGRRAGGDAALAAPPPGVPAGGGR